LFSGLPYISFLGSVHKQSFHGFCHASYGSQEGNIIQKFNQLLRVVFEHQVTHTELLF
jgi:hypothetical protein